MSGKGYKKRLWTTEDYEKIQKMYMQGVSTEKIGRHFKVSGATIRNKLKEMKVTA